MLTDELCDEVERLKREQDAVILAHYYVSDDAQDLADYIGDSYFLARKAATLDCKTLVFAGVEFMAESAKLLSPNKRVLMPDPTADCPMAHMMTKSTIDEARAEYGDDLAVACYVNSTTEMKAWSDVCVTSSNAQRIVERLPQHNVLFIPDMHLGHYIKEQVPGKNVILNDGFCPTHEAIELREVEALKAEHPDAVVCVHPECAAWLVQAADYVGSTSGIIGRVTSGSESDYIGPRRGGPRPEEALLLPAHHAHLPQHGKGDGREGGRVPAQRYGRGRGQPRVCGGGPQVAQPHARACQVA